MNLKSKTTEQAMQRGNGRVRRFHLSIILNLRDYMGLIQIHYF